MDNELAITTWSPIHPRSKLKELYWKADKVAVKEADFWEDTLRYLYMPRLRDQGVLAQAIVKGAATRDFFGTAYGQSGETFEGFKFGDSNVQFDDTLLLIEPGAASTYEATHPAKPDSSAPLSSQIPGSVAGAVELLTSDATKPNATAKRAKIISWFGGHKPIRSQIPPSSNC